MSSDRSPLVGGRRLALAVAVVGGGLVAALVADGGAVEAVGRLAAAGGAVVASAYALYRAYERNVADIDAEPRDDARTGSSTPDAGPEPARLFGLRDGVVRISPVWVLIAIAPLVAPTDPVPWFVFPVVGAVGLYLTHRLFEGPLAVP